MIMDLFNTENTVYVLDTSALIALDHQYKRSNEMFEAVWEEIEDLIVQGRLKVIDFEEEEIGKYEGKEDLLLICIIASKPKAWLCDRRTSCVSSAV